MATRITKNSKTLHSYIRPRNRSSRAKRSIHGNLCPTRRSTRLSPNLSTRLDSAQLRPTVIDSTDLAVTVKGRGSVRGDPRGQQLSSGGTKGQRFQRRVVRSPSRSCWFCVLEYQMTESYLTSGNNWMLIITARCTTV